MLTIIDYGVGNLASIKNMLKKAGFTEVLISGKEEDIARAEKLILPGVGHFDYGMSRLRESGFFDTLNRKVCEDKVPILGICLGAQLLTLGSEEGDSPGLGWIQAETIRFRPDKMDIPMKIPHMSWGEVKVLKDSKLYLNMSPEARFYFVHSFHIVCKDPEDELLSNEYGYTFTAGVERNNILGVQFHPEKSHKFGLALLHNFVNNF